MHKPTKAAVLISILLLAGTFCALFSGCSAEKKSESQVFAMDTVMLLTAYGENAEDALEAACDVIYTLDTDLDPEDAGSTVNELNRTGGPCLVSDAIADMFDCASLVRQRSSGAFDLAVYPIVKSWGFIGGDYRVPDDDELAGLLSVMDFGGITLETKDGGAYMTLPEGTQISFAAIAKGCASDMAVAAMRDAGCESAIISLGGNVQTLGMRPDGSSWSVGITDPEDTGSIVGVLRVGETAVVTSGSYQRCFELEGENYHHIIDPKTGRPASGGLLSVTVVCDDGVMADALSTALFILGENGAMDYYRTYAGFEMILITDDGRVILTSGLRGCFDESGNWEYYFCT